jgi:hypothetical protein
MMAIGARAALPWLRRMMANGESSGTPTYKNNGCLFLKKPLY